MTPRNMGIGMLEDHLDVLHRVASACEHVIADGHGQHGETMVMRAQDVRHRMEGHIADIKREMRGDDHQG